jgi:hypothetical protein
MFVVAPLLGQHAGARSVAPFCAQNTGYVSAPPGDRTKIRMGLALGGLGFGVVSLSQPSPVKGDGGPPRKG